MALGWRRLRKGLSWMYRSECQTELWWFQLGYRLPVAFQQLSVLWLKWQLACMLQGSTPCE